MPFSMKDEKGIDIDAWHRSSMPVGTPALYSVNYTVYSLQLTVYGVHCTVYSAQCTVDSKQLTVYSVHWDNVWKSRGCIMVNGVPREVPRPNL